MYNRNQPRNYFNRIIGFGFWGLVVYLLLVWAIGITLVNYILVSWFGIVAPGVIALLIAFVTGFNGLIPIAILTWLLNIIHVLPLHHLN